MPNGRLTRRTTPRLARGFAVLIVALAPVAGCQRFPLRYAQVTPESTSRPTTRVEPADADPAPPGELPSLDATPIADAAGPVGERPGPNPTATIAPPSAQPVEGPETAVADSPSPSPSPTPLIDEALNRAEVIKGLDDEARPAPVELASLAAKPAESPVELPPARESAAVATPPVPPKSAPEPTPPDLKTDRPGDVAEASAPEPAQVAEAPAPGPEPEPEKVAEAPGPGPEPGKVAEAPEPAEVVEAAPPKPEKTADTKPTPEPVATIPDPTAAPVDEWREGLSRVRQLALRRAGEPGDAAQAWAIRSRVLDWLAGEGPEPAGETGRVWNSVLATLSTATGPETPDESALAYHLGAAVDALESYAPLQITALSFCRKIDGFGHYDPVETPAVRPGQPLLVYCEMVGLRYENDDDRFRSRLSSRVEVLPADGGAAVWSEALGTADDLCRRRRRDYFVNYRIVVPAKLAPGSYSLRLSQTDMVSDRSVSASLPFSVKP